MHHELLARYFLWPSWLELPCFWLSQCLFNFILFEYIMIRTLSRVFMCVYLTDNSCYEDNSVTAKGFSDYDHTACSGHRQLMTQLMCVQGSWVLVPMSRHRVGTLEFSLSALLPQQVKVSPHPIATQIS